MNIALDPNRLLLHIYRNARDYAIFTFDLDARINSWNVGAELIFGYPANEVMGREVDFIFTPEDLILGQRQHEMHTAATQGRAADYRWHMRKDGSRFWADGVLTPLQDQQEQLCGYLKIARDITERKAAQDEIERLATSDVLTGLANRLAFDARRAEMTALSLRTGQLLLLLMIDLDRFKEVNDMLGHQAGDALLQQTAQRLRAVSRESDFIARLGGDEFALLQLNPVHATDGAALADKILATLARPFVIAGREVKISASIGIAVSPGDAHTPEDLLKQADLALYQAKNAGRSCFHYYTDELDRAAHAKSRDHEELRKVAAQRSFWLEYQPIVDCLTGRTVAMEALLRFPGPILSGYSVDDVIDMAQEIGVITDIGKWVFRTACGQLRVWQAAGHTDLRICINTCAKELLDPNYLPAIEAALAESQLWAGDVELELTERDAIELEKIGSRVIGRLREMGFLVALDDFGTGYSALSYLRTLPVTALKLDKSFLLGIPHDPDANAVARAVVNLAHDLGLKVVAEGVENQAQASFLLGLDCTAFQGHLLSSALSTEQATAWLQAHARQPRPAVT